MSGPTGYTRSLIDYRWEDILNIVCENASSDWESIVRSLGVSEPDIKRLQQEYATCTDRCRKGLQLWKNAANTVGLHHHLVIVLKKCKQRRLADIVSKICSNRQDISLLLAPHLDREVRMCEAFYEVTDGVHQHWRHLAKKLALSPSEIAEIESRDLGRSREKCMHTLYRWRLMVPLSEYKVVALVQALNACGFIEQADKLKPYTSLSDLPLPIRKKKKGEAILHIDVGHIDHQAVRPSTSMGSSRLATDVLREYALNKIFIRLKDSLDLQRTIGTHPLVSFLHDINRSSIAEVSRRGRYIVIKCQSRDEVHEIYGLARSGRMSDKITETLVVDEILRDMGLITLSLNAEIYDRELITARTEGSETYRSQTQAKTLYLGLEGSYGLYDYEEDNNATSQHNTLTGSLATSYYN